MSALIFLSTILVGFVIYSLFKSMRRPKNFPPGKALMKLNMNPYSTRRDIKEFHCAFFGEFKLIRNRICTIIKLGKFAKMVEDRLADIRPAPHSNGQLISNL